MGYEGEILLATLQYLQGSLSRVALHGEADRLIENTIDDVEGLALKGQSTLAREVVDAAPKNVVFRDDFFNIESVHGSLATVRGGSAFAQGVRDCLPRTGPQCRGQFVEQLGNVIGKGGTVQAPCGWELAHLCSPAR